MINDLGCNGAPKMMKLGTG